MYHARAVLKIEFVETQSAESNFRIEHRANICEKVDLTPLTLSRGEAKKEFLPQMNADDADKIAIRKALCLIFFLLIRVICVNPRLIFLI